MLLGKVKFRTWECNVFKGEYMSPKGRIHLKLVDSVDGEPVATATVNLPNREIGADEVFIKDYSENHGIYETLVNAGIIDRYNEKVQTGYVYVLKCKLL